MQLETNFLMCGVLQCLIRRMTVHLSAIKPLQRIQIIRFTSESTWAVGVV